MPVYCSFTGWLASHNKEYQNILSSLCYNEIKCNTFIVPSSSVITKMSAMAHGDKNKRRDCLKMISAMMIQINVSSKDFRPGTYKNNLGQSVKISAPSNGKFTVNSGKGFATKAEITINKTFEPDLQFSRDEDRHMCVCDLASGEIAIDGDPFTGSQPIRSDKTMGGSEFADSQCDLRNQAWDEIINITEYELKHCDGKLSELQGRICGLLKYVIMQSGNISEYNHYGDIIHTALSCEPLATFYILFQPFGSNPLLSQQVSDDWGFAPYICSNPSELYAEFCNKFPSKIDTSKRDQIISSIKESHGVNKLYDLQDAYISHCKELFSVIDYPCDMKLWCDEVCYFICARMDKIRKTKDIGAFRELCESLRNSYPGKNHKSESIINSDEYWSGFDKTSEIKNIGHFIDSDCCFKHCSDKHTDNLIPLTKSKFLKNIILLNSD